MASAMSTSSHARSRSLRSNTLNLKPLTNTATTTTTSVTAGPPSITLFLTNLRLLDLDLREDWPDITSSTFSTRDQKKRIQSVEWALYQLFDLWDPEETQDKLRPFFPPLEPLQSLNLRAALLRCLEQAKKNGVLGREVLLRKTMLDECKGERLEDILAVFSNAVLKKVVSRTGTGTQALAQQLALENFSYSGERSILSALIVAHKASLSKYLGEKNIARAKYQDFSDLLKLNERRILRRHEQLKEVLNDRASDHELSAKQVESLQDQVQKNWSGTNQWLDTMLYGDSKTHADEVLSASFEGLWRHVEAGQIGEIEDKKQVSLLEQLDSRVKDQERRLSRWQAFGSRLTKNKPPVKTKDSISAKENKLDLGFTKHQSLQLPRTEVVVDGAFTAPLEEYSRLIENMKAELEEVGQKSQNNAMRAPHVEPHHITFDASSASHISRTATPNNLQSPIANEDGWSSVGEEDEAVPVTEPTLRRRPEAPQPTPRVQPIVSSNNPPNPSPTTLTKNVSYPSVGESEDPMETAPRLRSQSPPELQARKPIQSEEFCLADQILSSVEAASPSPKKQRHTLSLAERTRLSMSRASHSQFSELHEEVDSFAELPRLSLKPNLAPVARASINPEDDQHAALIERTRKSMAGFEEYQKKAQVERRRSLKLQQKKHRVSTYFPKVEEEEPTSSKIDRAELIEGDPDYEDVFKSRPKIATSSALSPAMLWE